MDTERDKNTEREYLYSQIQKESICAACPLFLYLYSLSVSVLRAVESLFFLISLLCFYAKHVAYALPPSVRTSHGHE